ncbi:hypothetical protein C1645_809525 [Glomus cerebriforme]|uniref:Uncharacterized protein n=1 Tax=Glomus cerebriforme TaxID=658196 RepID=A0A397SFC6_9GLOM|nr:hypothetical protein C1645_809525 [Glomus cerebriforme]
MATIRPMFPLNAEVIQWCQNPKVLEEQFDGVLPENLQDKGIYLLKIILAEAEFPGEVLILNDNPLTFSLTTLQFHLIKTACLVIRKTRLYLQHIEKYTPTNAQPALFHALIYYGQDLIGGDPHIDPINLFHRWIIRSKYKDMDFGYGLNQSEKSIKILENLYNSLSQEFKDSVTSVDFSSSAKSINNIFQSQLAYELGEYYFSIDKGKSIEYLCKCRLESVSDNENIGEYKLFCDIDEARVEKLIRTLLEVTTDISLHDQINYFIQYGQDYEGVFLVMLKALMENVSLNISKDFRNNLVSNAFDKGQEKSGIKISICNVLNLSSDSSSEEMLNSIPKQCFHYLKHNFNENIVDEIAKIFKTLYGDFPGSKMSESQRSFVSSFFKKIENDDVLKSIKNIGGFEFVQYPLDQFFDEIAQFNLRCKNYKSGNLLLNGDSATNNNFDDNFDFLLEELNLAIRPENQKANNDSIGEVNLYWPEIVDLINRKPERDLNSEEAEKIENLCIDALKLHGIMEFRILEILSCKFMDFCRWQFLKNFFKNIRKLRFKDDYKSDKFSEHFRFCKIIISCVEILELFTNISQEISNKFDSTMYQKQFDIVFNMKFNEIEIIRSKVMKFFKVLSSRGVASKEPIFEVIAKLNQKWVHQVIDSMIAGYLCGQQWNQQLKQLNPGLYGPLTIIMMSSDCATKHWPDRSFITIAEALNKKIKPIKFDILNALIQVCLKSRINNIPKYIYNLRLADLYYLQGFASKSLRTSLDALISHSSNFMNMNNIDERVWQSYAIPQMIRCCLSKKEMIAALVLHQLIKDNITWTKKSSLVTLAINNGILQSSIFTRFIYETKLLLHIVNMLHKRGELVKCSQIIEWLKSSIQEESPSISNNAYIIFSFNIKHNESVYKSKKRIIGVDIDPNHRKVKIEELLFEFLKTFNLWIYEQLEDEEKQIYIIAIKIQFIFVVTLLYMYMDKLLDKFLKNKFSK